MKNKRQLAKFIEKRCQEEGVCEEYTLFEILTEWEASHTN